MPKKELSLAEARKIIEQHGYSLKPTRNYLKKTFEIQEDLLNRFMTAVEKRGYRVKDATAEAFENWIKKKG
jgi:hypothetical protein